MLKLISAQALVDQALREVKTYSVAQVAEWLNRQDPRVQLIDIRDVRELEEGTIYGAYHAPRGLLEFWVDPASPCHKAVFAQPDKAFILFCGVGWRSALAAKTLQDMGLRHVAHMGGGWAEWVRQGQPTETWAQQKMCVSKI